MLSHEFSSLSVNKSIFLDYFFSPRVILPKPLRCTTSSRTFTPSDPTSTASETIQLRFSRKERWSHRKFLFNMYSTLIIKNLCYSASIQFRKIEFTLIESGFLNLGSFFRTESGAYKKISKGGEIVQPGWVSNFEKVTIS